jgi:hypothetical protein
MVNNNIVNNLFAIGSFEKPKENVVSAVVNAVPNVV